MADRDHSPTSVALSALADQLDAPPPTTLAAFAAALSPLLDDVSWVAPMVADALADWHDAPMGEVPLRGFGTGPMAGVALVERPNVDITLGLLDSLFDTTGADTQLVFDDSFSLTILLAGGPMTIDRYDRPGAGEPVDSRYRRRLHAGDRLLLDHNISQMCLVALDRDAIILRVGCSQGKAAVTSLVYDSDSGLPVREYCTDMTASRMLALIDIAAASTRADKAAIIQRLCAHPLAALRWQAARHWLVIDPAAALPTIAAMAADDPDAAVRAAARATCAMIAAMTAHAKAA